MIKTKKVGVYYNELEGGDKVFYFNFKDLNDNNKLKWVKVGKYSEGFREANAVQQRAEQISAMRHGKDIRPIAIKKKKEIITYDSLAQIYFDDKNIAKDRISKYEIHIKPVFGKKNIHSITKQKVKDFLAALSKDGKAPQTVNGIRELLSAVINHNIKERDLKYINPCVGVHRLKVDNDRERYLTLDEIKILRDRVKDNFAIKLFVELSLQTGGRVQTILHITKKDINLSNGTVTLKNFKTDTTYTGFLQNDLIDTLKDYLKDLKANDYVVSFDDKAKILTQKNVQWRLKSILDEEFNKSLKSDDRKNRVVMHTLRHTFASHLAINGTPIFTIQKLMDHKKIEQTLRYAKLALENGKNEVEGLYKRN